MQTGLRRFCVADGANKRNFEIRSFSLSVKDQEEKSIFQTTLCNLNFLTTSIPRKEEFKAAFWLNPMPRYMNNDFGLMQTNASVKKRQFVYALTNFKKVGNKCYLLEDRNGALKITDNIEKINISVSFMDDFGNSTTKNVIFSR